jgi:acyl carrier protein
MKEKLIEFITKEFGVEDIEINEDTKLISSGLIDSFSLVSLQTYIAKESGKMIPAPRITAQSFDTVRQMLEIIDKY